MAVLVKRKRKGNPMPKTQRVIKFRARWKDTKKIVEDFMQEYGLEALNDEVFIVEQFTGLHDKNGKEIFEGDVLKDENNGSVLGHITEVVYFQPEFCLRDSKKRAFTLFRGGLYEVLGNVFENPELLK